MTRSSRRDWTSTLTDIRRFNAACRGGGPEALQAFYDLTSRLFCLTVGHKNAGVHLDRGIRHGHGTVVGGHGEDDQLIRLTNNHYLRLVIALYLPDGEDRHLRTSLSVHQYQASQADSEWVFRYDYKRDPQGNRHPAAHLHVNARLKTKGVSTKLPFDRVHFYTGRPTLEGTIRLLIEQFEVSSNSEPEVWRPALHESETSFLDVAHRPLPGVLS